jgi:tetratricopeptide (TPR) repeat protein
MKSLASSLAALILLILCVTASAHDGMAGMADMPAPAKLGAVSFDNSCKPQVKADFNRAVALLHSFWRNEAERTFEKVAAADPDCAIAYWGEAMAGFPQVNGWPEPSAVAAAQRALARADTASERSPREATYIYALHLFYGDYKPEEAIGHATRYADAMGTLAEAFPTDLEAKVFYALALLASDPPDDVELVNPKKAVAILYPLFRENPDHPGIAHYIIHACDNPEMAQQGLEAARRYALIAPAAPHALHMPGHIFARLGYWQDDIRSNLASKSAAENTRGMHVGAQHRLHAMEFLEYAYLQIGHDDEARAIVAEAKTVKQSDIDSPFPIYYSIVEARLPSLFAIETQDWTMGAHLDAGSAADRFSEGLILLAHAVAAAHLRDAKSGLEAARAIDLLVAKDPPAPTGSGPDTVHDEIHAWADFAQGDLESAIALLRPISERQAKVGKGEVELPAREMLAEMLLLRGKVSEALQEYQTSMVSDPNRFNALLGAARAAEQLGQRQLAASYYRTLLANCTGANGNALAELRHAQAVVR